MVFALVTVGLKKKNHFGDTSAIPVGDGHSTPGPMNLAQGYTFLDQS